MANKIVMLDRAQLKVLGDALWMMQRDAEIKSQRRPGEENRKWWADYAERIVRIREALGTDDAVTIMTNVSGAKGMTL